MRQHTISNFQAILLLTSMMVGLGVQQNLADAGSDFWLAMLIGWAVGYVVMLLVAALSALHPGQCLVGILIECLGKTAGRVVGILCAAAFLFTAGDVIQQFGYYEITIEIPETPLIFITACYALVIAFAVRTGLETLGRIGEVFFPVLCAVVLITMASLFTSFHSIAFLPVLKSGWVKPVSVGLRVGMLPFASVVAALAIFPNMTEPKKVFHVVNMTSLLTGICETAIVFRNIMVTGVQLSSRNIFPYEKVFRLMPGIDVYPLLDLDVMMSGILAGGVLLFAAVRTLGEIFHLEKFQIFTLPAVALAVSASQVYLNTLYHQREATFFLALYLMPALCGLCVILLAISLLRPANAPPAVPSSGTHT